MKGNRRFKKARSELILTLLNRKSDVLVDKTSTLTDIIYANFCISKPALTDIGRFSNGVGCTAWPINA